MRLGFLALLAVACSGSTTESVEYRSNPDEAHGPTAAYQVGDLNPIGPMPGLCSPSCKLLFLNVVQSPQYCWSLPEGECGAVAGGWYADAAPECGEVGLWVSGCFWNPSGGCEVGSFYEAWQGCE